MNVVFVKNYTAPAFNKKEILRYAGCSNPTAEVEALIDECISECEGVLSYKVCYTELPVSVNGGMIDFSVMQTESTKLAKNLSGCHSVIAFAATVGLELDRLIARYGRISPSKALIFQAIGAERIESLCDAFNDEIKNQYRFTRPRFSPGYGDFSITAQRDIFRVLDCYRKIGLSLNESMLMSPSKSVTAVIGISDCDTNTDHKKCADCEKIDCSFRSIDYNECTGIFKGKYSLS